MATSSEDCTAVTDAVTDTVTKCNSNCALFICSKEVTPETPHPLLQRLISLVKHEQPIKEAVMKDGFFFYPLTLDNKYYDGSIDLCPLSDPKFLPAALVESVEAAIIFIENTASTDFDYLNMWATNLNIWEADLLLCVCESQVTDMRGEKPLLTWCIKNGFELIELQPDAEFIKEAENLGEKIGIDRVYQALQSHPWPAMQLKPEKVEKVSMARSRSKPQSRSDSGPVSRSSPDRKGSNRPSVTDEASGGETSTVTGEKLGLDVDNKELLYTVLGTDDPGAVPFEELFDKFASLKSQAEHLPEEERKAFAEKVTMQFWKAVGGSDSEIDLSDKSDKEQ